MIATLTCSRTHLVRLLEGRAAHHRGLHFGRHLELVVAWNELTLADQLLGLLSGLPQGSLGGLLRAGLVEQQVELLQVLGTQLVAWKEELPLVFIGHQLVARLAAIQLLLQQICQSQLLDEAQQMDPTTDSYPFRLDHCETCRPSACGT